jgi:GR25 family glycosyltransferase involved in LPS biosynthesis
MEDILKAPAFVIHMDIPQCKQRKPFFMNSLTNAGFSNIHIIDGVDVRTDEDLERNMFEFGTKYLGKKLSRGQIGCFLSHMKVYKKIINENIPFATIFEDDVFFHPQWNILSKEYYDKTPKDYDIVWMGTQCGLKDKDLPEIVSMSSFCPHAYIITKKGAQILTSLLIHVTSDPKFESPIDCAFIDQMVKINNFKNENKLVEKSKFIWLKPAMKKEFIVSNTRQPPANTFVWYNWNGRKYPCEESKNQLDDRNDGLVFQSDTFISVIHLNKE